MVNFSFQVLGDPDVLLAELCPNDQDGHVDFGSAGRSRAPTNYKHLFEGQVEFRVYVLEGFVTYTLSLKRTAEGLRFIGSTTGDSMRHQAIGGCLKHYLISRGVTVSASAI